MVVADRSTDLDDDAVQRSAVLSRGGSHRYRLDRTWGSGPVIAFVMLNPSTADAFGDDPTIRRCMGFGRKWGGAGVVIVNLTSFRSPHPRKIPARRPPRAYRDANERAIAGAFEMVAASHGTVIAGWGARVDDPRLGYLGESIDVVRQLAETQALVLQCLGVTQAGHPRHPLYVRADTPVKPWASPSLG